MSESLWKFAAKFSGSKERRCERGEVRFHHENGLAQGLALLNALLGSFDVRPEGSGIGAVSKGIDSLRHGQAGGKAGGHLARDEGEIFEFFE